MFLFDLHCDTVTACMEQLCMSETKILQKNSLHLDLERGNKLFKWVQVFAFWIDDSYKGEKAYDRFYEQLKFFESQRVSCENSLVLYRTNKAVLPHICNAILAIEGGHALGGKLPRVLEFKQLGISYMTLVWNGDNELGSGSVFGSDNGLTLFGKDVVREMERVNMAVDVSHLNESGFYDVCDIAKKPFMATHSNARNICDNPRNLWDSQLGEMIDRKCLCGINFYPLFVNGIKDANAPLFMTQILNHIEHILSIGGQDILAIGTDFDGALMPHNLDGIQKISSLYEYMSKWYDDKILNKIFFENAKTFFDKNINI